MKILLVSDTTNFALTDVYYGYKHAFETLGIDHEIFPYHSGIKSFSQEVTLHIIHSSALIKSKGITHIMLIGGLNIPQWMFESLYHLKTVVVSTEDPHSFDPLKDQIDKIDYYFSNERSIGKYSKYENVFYCPTAGSTHACAKMPYDQVDDFYKSDLLFLGAVYPNRAKMLEALIPLVEKHKLTFKICGHPGYMPKRSPLWKYVCDARTIPHHETVMYYNGSKAVINIMRDVKWNARNNTRRNPFNSGKFPPESLNPRSYEVPLCQSFLLQDDSRPEARDIFSKDEVGFFNDAESLVKAARYYLVGRGKQRRKDMALKSYRKVAEKHTYYHRLLSIKEVLEKDM